MNIASTLNYQLSSKWKSVVIYYAIFYSIIIFSAAMMYVFDGEASGSINSMEMSSSIFLFVVGLNSFKVDFKFFLANGQTRKSLFVSFFLSGILLACAMAVIDMISANVFSLVVNYNSLVDMLFNYVYPQSGLFISFLFTSSLYFIILVIGFLITNIYYALNKIGKVLVSVLVPATILIILPYIDGTYFNFRLFGMIKDAFAALLGIYPTNHPMIAVTSFFIGSLLLGGCSYILMRRSTLKEN